MGRKSIPILLKVTSPEGETKTFTSIGKAAKELGFNECGVGKAFHEHEFHEFSEHGVGSEHEHEFHEFSKHGVGKAFLTLLIKLKLALRKDYSQVWS